MPENQLDNLFFGLILMNISGYIKNQNIFDALPCIASLLKVFYKLELIWGSNL